MNTRRRIRSRHPGHHAFVIASATAALAGCQVDEITFGVGNARTEDAFGAPVVQPYQEGDSLRLYRIEIERDKPEESQEPPAESGTDEPEDYDVSCRTVYDDPNPCITDRQVAGFCASGPGRLSGTTPSSRLMGRF